MADALKIPDFVEISEKAGRETKANAGARAAGSVTTLSGFVGFFRDGVCARGRTVLAPADNCMNGRP